MKKKIHTLSQWGIHIDGTVALGNSVQQASNLIYYALSQDSLFYVPPHPQFEEIANCTFPFVTADLIKKYFFYYGYDRLDRVDFDCDPEELNNNRHSVIRQHLVPSLRQEFRNLTPLDSNTLVIHLRSGDNISKPNNLGVHPLYVMNPLSFYVPLVERFKEVIIITEKDRRNPVMKHLQKYNHVKVQSSSLNEDLSILLRARNLVSSGVGTFCIAAALLSLHLENFYCTSLYLKEHLNPTMLRGVNVKMTDIDQKDYISIGEWEASQKQFDKMIGYQI